MIQELAGWDPSRYDEVVTMRMRDGLEAFVQRAKERALEEYRFEVGVYVAGGLKKKPKFPSILRRGNAG